MTALLFFCYLQGDWDIEREIIDKSSSLSNAVAQGKVSISKKNTNILNYQESLEVKWSTGFVSKSKKKYDYILDNSGNLGLYSYEQGSRCFMFNLLTNLVTSQNSWLLLTLTVLVGSNPSSP